MAVTIKPSRADGLLFEGIAADTAHLVCRSDHPLARKKEVRWRDLSAYPFTGITAISSVRRLTDAGFVQGDVSVEPRIEVEQVPCAVALVEAGLGITALPSLTFAMFKGRKLAMRPLRDPVLRRNVGFVTLSERNLPSFVEPLKQEIRSILQEELRSKPN
jgi:DNA-binding transcriptional LysR family regulator